MILYIRIGSRTLKVFEADGKVINAKIIPNLPGNTFAVQGWDLLTEEQSSEAHEWARDFYDPRDEEDYLQMDRPCQCGSGSPWHSCSAKDSCCG
jgi:hypothetical protein